MKSLVVKITTTFRPVVPTLVYTSLEVIWGQLRQDMGLTGETNWTIWRNKLVSHLLLEYSFQPYVTVSTPFYKLWYPPPPFGKYRGILITAKMKSPINILLSILLFTNGAKGNRELMTKEVIAKLDPVGEKVGYYSMGEKARHQAFLTIPHLGTLPIRIKEMDEISVTTIRLDFKEVEDLGNKNLENVVVAYPGQIECSGDSDCESRKGVARSNFRGCIDVYSDWSAAMRATCIMKSPTIPHDVMASNLDADRAVDSAIGFTETGYIPSSRRFQTKLKGVHDLWVSTKKSIPSLMSKRFRRDPTEGYLCRESTEGNFRRGTIPLGVSQARRRQGEALSLRLRRELIRASTGRRFRKEVIVN